MGIRSNRSYMHVNTDGHTNLMRIIDTYYEPVDVVRLENVLERISDDRRSVEDAEVVEQYY